MTRRYVESFLWGLALFLAGAVGFWLGAVMGWSR